MRPEWVGFCRTSREKLSFMSGSRVNVRSCIGSGRNWRKTD
jgi:hypothetical protein